jgi:hypothetical protein
MRGSLGPAAAIAVAIFSFVALALGILLLTRLGGTSGQDLGSAAGADAFARAVPLLFAAELLKLLTACAQLVVVIAVARPAPERLSRVAMLILGSLGAFFIAASGVAGIEAIAAEDPGQGGFISNLGFVGVAATGAWALLVTLLRPLPLPRWLLVVGALFGLVSLAAFPVPPLALLTVVLGWPWWIGLSGVLRSARAQISQIRESQPGAGEL